MESVVKRAEAITNFDWGAFMELEKECKSEEELRQVRRIISREYHREEAMAGNL